MTAPLIIRGDARHLPLPDTSIHAIVTDPPYGLEFMGREWDTFRPANARMRTRQDQRTNPSAGKSTVTVPEAYVAGGSYQDWCQQWASECLRVLKPGGFLLAFGGSRTHHRLACAIEDAGFEIRDSVQWIFGSGFPKSRNVTNDLLAIPACTCRVGSEVPSGSRAVEGSGRRGIRSCEVCSGRIGEPVSGLGTALKPASEPIIVARKPLTGTVAATVLAHGTGALNIDGCRIPATDPQLAEKYASVRNAGPRVNAVYGADSRPRSDDALVPHSGGRWPPNVLLGHSDTCAPGGQCVSTCPVRELDEQGGDRRSSGHYAKGSSRCGSKAGDASIPIDGHSSTSYADSGGASRFFPRFRYQAKAAASERPKIDGKGHPTVKPLALMQWLVRLVTPPGGLVLDPFCGSGTTLQAAHLEGFRAIGLDSDPASIDLAIRRLTRWQHSLFDLDPTEVPT